MTQKNTNKSAEYFKWLGNVKKDLNKKKGSNVYWLDFDDYSYFAQIHKSRVSGSLSITFGLFNSTAHTYIYGSPIKKRETCACVAEGTSGLLVEPFLQNTFNYSECIDKEIWANLACEDIERFFEKIPDLKSAKHALSSDNGVFKNLDPRSKNKRLMFAGVIERVQGGNWRKYFEQIEKTNIEGFDNWVNEVATRLDKD